MNEIQPTTSWLDFSDMGEDATYLREKAVEYASIELKGRFEKGRILEEIHQKYANNKVGQYRKFCEKLKIPKSTADRDRKFYNYIVPIWDNMGDVPDLLNGQFDALASGKANPELAKAVEAGEIKNSKEYKEMEKRLAEAEEKVEQGEQEVANLKEKEAGYKATIRDQADKLAKGGNNDELEAMRKAFTEQAKQLKKAQENAEMYRQNWNEAKAEANMAHEMANRNVEESPKYKALKKENETIKAHLQNKPVEQHAKETNQPELRRTQKEERQIIDVIDNVTAVLSKLPVRVELEEWAKVYTKEQSELLSFTKETLDRGISKLQILAEAFNKQTGIRRVK